MKRRGRFFIRGRGEFAFSGEAFEGEVVLEGPYASIADHPRLRELVPAVSRAA